MLSREADRVLRYLSEFKISIIKPINGAIYNPVLKLFLRMDSSGYWFGIHRINLTSEKQYILADITDLDVHTFGLTIQQALIRAVEHAATYYEDLDEDGIVTDMDSEHYRLLESAFKEMCSRIEYQEDICVSDSNYSISSVNTNTYHPVNLNIQPAYA